MANISKTVFLSVLIAVVGLGGYLLTRPNSDEQENEFNAQKPVEDSYLLLMSDDETSSTLEQVDTGQESALSIWEKLKESGFQGETAEKLLAELLLGGDVRSIYLSIMDTLENDGSLPSDVEYHLYQALFFSLNLEREQQDSVDQEIKQFFEQKVLRTDDSELFGFLLVKVKYFVDPIDRYSYVKNILSQNSANSSSLQVAAIKVDTLNFATIESDVKEVVADVDKLSKNEKASIASRLIDSIYNWGIENGKPTEVGLVSSIEKLLIESPPLIEPTAGVPLPSGAMNLSDDALDEWIDENPIEWMSYVQQIENQPNPTDIDSWVKVNGILAGETSLDDYLLRYAQDSQNPLEVISIMESVLRQNGSRQTEYAQAMMEKFSQDGVLVDKLRSYMDMENTLTPANKNRVRLLLQSFYL